MTRAAFFEAFYNLFSPEVRVNRGKWYTRRYITDAVPPGFAAIYDAHHDLIMLVPDEDGQPEQWAQVLNALEDCYYGRLK